MSETKIKVPEGMLKAIGTAPNVCHCSTCESGNEERLKSALRWLSEDWEASEELLRSMQSELKPYVEDLQPFTLRNIATILAIASRRMFLAPEPETSLPEEWIRACARNVPKGAVTMKIYSAQGILLETVDLEAYRRGQQSK
jgi:hypothetical protein